MSNIIITKLTQGGIRKLTNGQSLNPTYYAFSDSGVPYELYNENAIQGQQDKLILATPLPQITQYANKYFLYTPIGDQRGPYTISVNGIFNTL